MIEVKSLAKQFGQVQALTHVTFSAQRGDVVGFLGPNGAGKTTTLRLLTTFLSPSAGEARIAGFDIVRESAEVRKRIGYLPDTPALYPELTVREYLTFLAKIRGVPSRTVRRSVDSVVERCGLAEVVSRVTGQLSKGYRQRVGLAQAIIHDPEVVILDEPTSGLDPRQIMQLRELIRELAQERTVLLSTHVLAEVSAVCSKAVIINGGCTVYEQLLTEMPEHESLERTFMRCVGGSVQPPLSSVEEEAA